MKSDGMPPWTGEVVELCPPVVPQSDVWAKLRMQGSGGNFYPAADVDNIITVLEGDDRWRERLRWNEFTATAELDEEPISDNDEIGAARWLTSVYKMRAVKPRPVGEFMRYVAAQNAYHPVRAWLESLEWDGEPRLHGLLHKYVGAESTPLHSVLGRKWAISAVARVMRPGCKVDTVLTLIGPKQGEGKSTFFLAMAHNEDWFSDSQVRLDSKEGYGSIQGVWLYELAELDSVRKSENSAVKAFISGKVDKYRKAYGRNDIRVKRQCVFVGTTNRVEFINDPTGSRRFWPVVVGKVIDNAGTKRDAAQLWAEAVQLFRDGGEWWLTKEEQAVLDDKSTEFREQDPWLHLVLQWAEGRIGGFTTADILTEGLKKEPGTIERRHQMRVAAMLATAGYVKKEKRISGVKAYYWEEAPAESKDS